VGLLVCLAAAVLAFGGTTPLPWAAVQLGAFLLFGFVLWKKDAPGRYSQLPWLGPLLLLGYVGVQSAFVHPDVHLVGQQLLRLLAYLCVFCVAAFVASGEKSRVRLVAGMIALGLFEALYGLVQYVSGWQQIFTYKKVFYIAVATGTYINPNHFAGLLEMILPFSLAWTLYWFECIHPSPESPQRPATRFARGEAIGPLVFFLFSTLLLFAGIVF
jgi:hypothetical protein